MEGLLPMVYRVIKKNRTRKQYQCLSSGAALSYNISMAEIYPQSQLHDYQYQAPSAQKAADYHAEKIGHHRRYKSVGDFANGFSSPHQQRTGAGSPSSKQLAKIRSHRIFSCVTGV